MGNGSTTVEAFDRYRVVMLADADLATVGALMGDRTRACFLLALLGGQPLTASNLAARARVSGPLASSHLSKLLQGGLLTVERRGRNRYYELADLEIARAVEALLAIAPHREARSLREISEGRALRQARTCYDHLAGELGVGLTEALHRRGVLIRRDDRLRLSRSGRSYLQGFGLDFEALDVRRRPLTRQCLDWTERRPHLAGALGAAFADRLFALGWLRRSERSRVVGTTPEGSRGLADAFGLDLGGGPGGEPRD